jgi:hypothetical protein
MLWAVNCHHIFVIIPLEMNNIRLVLTALGKCAQQQMEKNHVPAEVRTIANSHYWVNEPPILTTFAESAFNLANSVIIVKLWPQIYQAGQDST